MRKRALVVVLVLLVAMTASVYAASTGSIGLLNYATLSAFEAGDEAAYVPGLRAEFFLSDYLGVSADALLLESWPDDEVYLMMYIVAAVARLPFGLIEPYFALGPAYLGVIADGETTLAEDSFGFNTRAGVDFNIFDWLSVGVEANFFVDDLEYFFNNIDSYFSEEGLNNSIIGVSAKFKF